MQFHHTIKPYYLLSSVMTLSGCSLGPTEKHLTYHPDKSHIIATPAAHAITKPQARLDTKFQKISHQGISLSIVSYDSRSYSLNVADQVKGPGSIWETAKSAAEAQNAIAAINAGFFTPEGKPLGLVIENSNKRGTFNTSSLGKGIYYVAKKKPKIQRNTHIKSILKKKPSQLLQAGPMLVENKKVTVGLSRKNTRPRSFIATDGENHWCIGHASACTLDQLAQALSTLNTSFTINLALNLDGGRSSDLWVSDQITKGAHSIRPFWNKPVRNFLLLKKR